MTEPFTWIEEELLLVSRYPDHQFGLTELARLGVTELINLEAEPHSSDALATAGIEQHHLPVEDFTAPTMEVLDQALGVIQNARIRGAIVGIHCRFGLGRSGTLAAAWLVRQGLSAEEAVARVRTLRPGSIETADQKSSVYAYAELMKR